MSSDEASSPYDSDSSESSSSEEEQQQIAKPVFISKKNRTESPHQASTEDEDKRKREVLLSKLSTDQTITSEGETNKPSNEDFDGIDDTDDLNPEEEYNAWKQREVMRFNRDQQLIIEKEILKEEALQRAKK
ncbi:uncharacterized protein SPAPADRAFT_51088 [Spathaspora passalidarum NRRL Y-27907]|uniref:Micro-fibrillar-associated protein 1 C-terminal domain-containing protein n=1 Tax=Spathaspora passalidarum (strain NRRL Y-27907 / 11-Y1) TaxID=619300 RepID=G3ANL3_SPAPN|nr:uncharacterized protein SPAPADRAFT_51088 [Spathaspora passalidarum NRRL Y-27907]EGW32542.1 hypothetical protein SPAPADRAFT_51088 [Spathaspora passalidarum NRRL Y-27907]